MIASYGSYFRALGDDASRSEPAAFVTVAERLGTNRVRVWAGAVASADAWPDERAVTPRELRHAWGLAAGAGVEVALNSIEAP